MKYDLQKNKMMMFNRNLLFAGILMFFLIYMAVHPAWGEIQPELIKAGDRAELNIICRESSGEIILTSYPEIAKNPSQKKSVIYQKPIKFEPLRIVAGESEKYSGIDPLKTFNNELLAGLSKAIVGMRVGQSTSLTFTAPAAEGLKQDERYVILSRKRIMPKKVIRPKAQYVIDVNKEPVIGQEVPTAIGLTARVVSVKGDDVEVIFVGKQGDHIETPWGKGILHDQGEKWRLELEPHVGRLVRTGNYVGRISLVEADRYKVDFGFPFGNETIVCDISVVSIIGKNNENK